MRRTVAVLMVVLAVGCSTKTRSASGTTAVPRDERDGDSSLACDHFRNIAGDVSKGILTDAELRAKLQEVNENAIIGTPAVQAAATAMLAAVTSGTDAEFIQAINDMDAACDAAGHSN